MAIFNFNISQSNFQLNLLSEISTDCATYFEYKVIATPGDVLDITLMGTSTTTVTWVSQSYKVGLGVFTDWINETTKTLTYSSSGLKLIFSIENSSVAGFFNGAELTVANTTTGVTKSLTGTRFNDGPFCNVPTAAMDYRGAYDASANPDSSAAKGDTFTVTVAGSGVSSYWSTELSVGDMIIAETANPSSEADWTEINKNIADIVSASTTAKGLIELATQMEVNTGTDTTKAITPNRLVSTLGITATLSTTLTFSDTIGNGVLTSIPVTHNIGNQFVQASIYEGTEKVECQVVLTSASVTTFVFNVAPTTNQYRVVITG